MNEKDAAVIKALAELGLHKEEPLTPEQESLLKRAVDPEEEFLHQVQQIFQRDTHK
jgi:hypothetical protein